MPDREQISRDIKIIEGMPEGERVIAYLLEFCHVFVNSMPPDCNPNMTLFNEGQRSVGNEIVSLLVNEPHRFKRETLRKIANNTEDD